MSLNREQNYQNWSISHKQTEAQYMQRGNIVSWLRLAMFAGIIISLFLITRYSILYLGLSMLFIAAFLILLKLHQNYLKKMQLAGYLHRLCENEIKFLHYRFLEFPDGNEYAESSHPFSSDIDLTGTGSVFQYLNRTVTPMGRNELVRWLTIPLTDNKEILSRQEACREMSSQPEWRLCFAAMGIQSMQGD